MPNDPPQKFPRVLLVFVAIVLAVVGVGIVLDLVKKAKERDAWLAFKAAHRCTVVSHRDGVPITIVTVEAKGPNSVTQGTSAAQTGWQCDDGTVRFVDDE